MWGGGGGGVYPNINLETLWLHVLIHDGGGGGGCVKIAGQTECLRVLRDYSSFTKKILYCD